MLMNTNPSRKSPLSTSSFPGCAASAKWATVSVLGIAILGTLTAPVAQAASNSWGTTVSGTWSNPSDWAGGAIIPGNTTSGTTATTDVATFSTTGAKTITPDAGRTIFGLTFATGSGINTIGSSAQTLFLSSGGAIQNSAGLTNAQQINANLRLAGAGATYSFTNNASSTSATLQFGGQIQGATAGNTVLFLDGTNTSAFNRLNGTISNGSSTSLAIVKNGSGQWVLNSNSFFTGGVTLNAGTLSIRNAGALGTGAFTINGGSIDAPIAIVNSNNNAQNWNGNFTFVGSNTLDLGTGSVTMNATRTVTTTSSTLTIGGAIGGSGFGLTKAGAGTLVLGGASTYTGTTTVNAGTLLVNGSTASSSAVAVNGGKLGGSGAIGGSVTVNSGGTLAPGSSIQSLASGSLAFNNGSTFGYEVDSGVLPSVGADLQVVNGTLGLNGTVNLTLSNLSVGTFANGTEFTLINYSGAWNNGLFTYNSTILNDGDTFTFNGQDWTIDYNDTVGGVNFSGEYLPSSSFVNITAVPEPAAGMLAAFGLTTAVAFRRSRKAA